MKKGMREYYIQRLDKETKCLAQLMDELLSESRRLWTLMRFFYEYGFKKYGVTPEERTLRSIAESFNKNCLNKYEEINVTANEMEFLLRIIRQMILIRATVGEIDAAGYRITLSGNQWYFSASYFY